MSTSTLDRADAAVAQHDVGRSPGTADVQSARGATSGERAQFGRNIHTGCFGVWAQVVESSTPSGVTDGFRRGGVSPYSDGVALAKQQGRRVLDRILDDHYVADVTAIPLEELRSRRAQTDREEAWLSYIRRMLHGRIDILEATVAMRGEGERPYSGDLDIEALVASLATRMGPGSQPPGPDVVDSPGAGRRAVERLIARAGLDEHSAMTNAELDDRLDELREMEREVSDVRQRVHEVQDQLTAELARRYRTGEARADSALKGDS